MPTPGFTIIGKKSRLRYFLGLAPLAYVSLLTNAVAVVTALANCLPHSAAAGRSRPPPAVPMAPKLLGDHVALVRSLACSDNNQGTLKMKATRQSTRNYNVYVHLGWPTLPSTGQLIHSLRQLIDLHIYCLSDHPQSDAGFPTCKLVDGRI